MVSSNENLYTQKPPLNKSSLYAKPTDQEELL